MTRVICGIVSAVLVMELIALPIIVQNPRRVVPAPINQLLPIHSDNRYDKKK